jgi:hypothetical protein
VITELYLSLSLDVSLSLPSLFICFSLHLIIELFCLYFKKMTKAQEKKLLPSADYKVVADGLGTTFCLLPPPDFIEIGY